MRPRLRRGQSTGRSWVDLALLAEVVLHGVAHGGLVVQVGGAGQGAQHDDIGALWVAQLVGDGGGRDLDDLNIVAVGPLVGTRELVDQQDAAGLEAALIGVDGGLIQGVDDIRLRQKGLGISSSLIFTSQLAAPPRISKP